MAWSISLVHISLAVELVGDATIEVEILRLASTSGLFHGLALMR